MTSQGTSEKSHDHITYLWEPDVKHIWKVLKCWVAGNILGTIHHVCDEENLREREREREGGEDRVFAKQLHIVQYLQQMLNHLPLWREGWRKEGREGEREGGKENKEERSELKEGKR